MRTLKFRAWSKEEKEYYYDAEYTYDFCCSGRGCYTESFGEVLNQPERFIVEQYTGLKDKNGKDIYDGDLVEQFVYGVKSKGKEVECKTVWQVRWNEQECCFELHYVRGSLFGDSLMSIDDDYEVIGNIHEPPKDFSPEHLKRMGLSISRGGEE